MLTLSLESKDLDYNEAMSVASKQIGQLHQAIEMIGFDKESLKTSIFNVKTSYERVKGKGDNYKNVFDGYVVSHSLKLAFDLEAQRLAEVLSAISATTPARILTLLSQSKILQAFMNFCFKMLQGTQ